MQLVGEFLNRGVRGKFQVENSIQLPLPDALMGVEVEVDQDTSTEVTFPSDYYPEWQQKGDGSLVNGYEYVLSFPLAGNALVSAIHKLYQEPTSVKRTFTGSTHIHIDMMDNVSIDALRTLVLMTYALENILYAAGDLSRQWCGFANRLTSAPSEMLEHILAIEDVNTFNYNVNDIGRYYGLNLQALLKYGSAEFRYFPTAESAEELLRWVKLVQLFKKAAMDVGTVDNLLSMFNTEQGYNDFLSTYFSDYPTEVEAIGGYMRMKALVNKAMIILKSKKNKKAANKSYTKAILEGKFKGVLATAVKRMNNIKLAIRLNPSGGSAPRPTDVVRDYVAEHGTQPDLAVLVHSGQLYVATTYEYASWDYATSMMHRADVAAFTENVVALESELVAQLEEMGRSTTARDLEYYFQQLRSNYEAYLNPEPEDYDESEMDEEDY